jgi:methionyl-tRNA formyltransferase
VKAAVLGRTRMLSAAARALREHGHEVVLVVAPAGPQHAAEAARMRALARDLVCPFEVSADLGAPAALAAVAASGAEVGVSVNWPTIVPPPALSAFARGVLNAHAGDLPRYRGNATIGWAILAGEPSVAVTVHRMDAGLDSGPVLAKRALALDDATYVGDVLAWCEEVVPQLFVEVLDGLAGGTLAAVAQPDALAAGLRCFPRTPADGWIEWAQDAALLARLVRASAEPFDGAFTAVAGQRLTIWRAHAERLPYEHLGVPGQVVELRRGSGEVAVLCGAGSGVLVLERVALGGGGTPVAATDVLSSTRTRLGLHVPTALDDLVRRVATLEGRTGDPPS